MDKTALVKLGGRIREIREGKRLTQKQLSKMSGVYVSRLSDIERGKSKPLVPTLDAIIRELNIHPYELYALYFEAITSPDECCRVIFSCMEREYREEVRVGLERLLKITEPKKINKSSIDILIIICDIK